MEAEEAERAKKEAFEEQIKKMLAEQEKKEKPKPKLVLDLMKQVWNRICDDKSTVMCISG